MMGIDRFNLTFTMVSIIVTALSIVFSLVAIVSAKRAKQYKNEALQIVEAFGIEGLHSKFLTESNYFLNNTRDKNWYKGKDIKLIISPFKEVLASFGQFYHLVKDSNGLKCKVHELNGIIQTYDMATSTQRKRVNRLILEIIDILAGSIHDNTQKIIRK